MNNLKQIYQILYKAYGSQGWWPLYNAKTGKFEYHKGDYSLPKNDVQRFEICLGAILTQNTSWKNVEKAILNLIKNNLFDINALRKMKTESLAKVIKSSGYHNQKAKKIKEFIRFLDSKKKITRENLLSVWGIGKETADSILLYAYKKPVFVIDAYTKRIFSRLLNKEFDYDSLQKLFMSNLKNDFKLFNEYHALLVEHGKNKCKSKPNCPHCLLNRCCKLSSP